MHLLPLGGFTLRPSFFDPKVNNQKINIDSITAAAIFVTNLRIFNPICSWIGVVNFDLAKNRK